MKAYIRHIGLVDHKDQVHSVSLVPGLNIVTGKSSTGKSALIEIFDYCFGSSEFTVPEGVITQNATVYFVVIRIQDTNLILARNPSPETKDKGFISEEFDESIASNPAKLNSAYFDKRDFLPLDDFKKQVGRRFGLIFTDVDEDLAVRQRRMFARRAPTPSIRSFTSFLLQHQNLVANKHAIFYRFDEKEKKDQVIEHFKIFMGFVTPEYFQLVQELQEWERQLRLLEFQLPKAEELNKISAEKVRLSLADFSAISGTPLVQDDASALLMNPAKGLEKIRSALVTVNSLSIEHLKQREALERQKSSLLAVRRDEQRKLGLISSSIEDVKRYLEQAEAVPVPTEENFRTSICPFCDTNHPTIEKEANKLAEAIEWLNEELKRSSYMPASLVEEEKSISRSLATNSEQLRDVEQRIDTIDQQVSDYKKQRSQFELAVKAKVQVEIALEQVVEDKASELKLQIDRLKGQINERRELLKRDFDIQSQIRRGETLVNGFMRDIGSKFEFEESFRPINLHFSFETFDLWHEIKQGNDIKRVYLRSMGSGANWLYSHLTLFLALHRYFCTLGKNCLVPSIVFFDQPSQVYFPTILDTDSDFDPKSIAKKDLTRNRPVDEDISAVTNLFSRLVEFCDETKTATGIEPQIIVTDHADNLSLSGNTSFQSLVRAKWRTRGLVEMRKV